MSYADTEALELMGTTCSVKSYKCSKCSLSALTEAHNRFANVYYPVDNTLCKVSP